MKEKEPKQKLTINELPLFFIIMGLLGIVLSVFEITLHNLFGKSAHCSLRDLFSLACGGFDEGGHMGFTYILFGLGALSWLLNQLLKILYFYLKNRKI